MGFARRTWPHELIQPMFSPCWSCILVISHRYFVTFLCSSKSPIRSVFLFFVYCYHLKGARKLTLRILRWKQRVRDKVIIYQTSKDSNNQLKGVCKRSKATKILLSHFIAHLGVESQEYIPRNLVTRAFWPTCNVSMTTLLTPLKMVTMN